MTPFLLATVHLHTTLASRLFASFAPFYCIFAATPATNEVPTYSAFVIRVLAVFAPEGYRVESVIIPWAAWCVVKHIIGNT